MELNPLNFATLQCLYLLIAPCGGGLVGHRSLGRIPWGRAGTGSVGQAGPAGVVVRRPEGWVIDLHHQLEPSTPAETSAVYGIWWL